MENYYESNLHRTQVVREIRSIPSGTWRNSVANLISVPFQNNINFNTGPHNETQNMLNIQPVLPFNVNSDWNVITRPILSVISQPDFGTAPAVLIV